MAENDASLPTAKRALMALREMRTRLEEVERRRTEPIAIVGMGCRFPGGADGPDRFWELLEHKVDATREIPEERWDADAYYDPDPSIPGRMNLRRAALLEGVDGFDRTFFGISPREAAAMDPQQRLCLEVAWEALENGGLVATELAGSSTGVFIGANTIDYFALQLVDAMSIGTYSVESCSCGPLANRISYQLDLRGPSLSMDSACSSALAAVHVACESLRAGDCEVALAGAVNLVLSPEAALAHAKSMPLSPRGQCRTFDAGADGYARADGCGVVVLKRLSEAVADGDRIQAVIRASAMNQDGRTNGMGAPNGLAQRAVIRQALAKAGITPSQVTYIETHGTGTTLGDPIEVEALAETYGGTGGDCALGAVKTNLGHLEAAAGIAGLIKVALAFDRETIPANLHFERLNPHISLDSTRLSIPTAARPWPAGEEPRYAALSAFGAGGTNTHLILEEPPREPAAEAAPEEPPAGASLLPLSARSAPALKAQAASYRALLARPEGQGARRFREVCRSAARTRVHFDHRLAVVASSGEEAVQLLDGYLAGKTSPDVAAGRHEAAGEPAVVFVFPGSGSQWVGMGRELLASEPVFREVLERCEEIHKEEAGWSLLEELAAPAESSRFAETARLQPVLFAVEVGIAELWRSWGIEPHAVVGHSFGEVAAAAVSGALALPDAVRLMARRSRLLGEVSGKGAMAAVGLPPEEAREAIAGSEDRLSVAVVNGPTSTVVSGETGALEELGAAMEAKNVFFRRVKVDVASHSPQVAPLAERLPGLVADVEPREAEVPLYSTVTGGPIDGRKLDGAYWARNLREQVRFAAAVEHLLDDGFDVFLEMSPHPVLRVPMEQAAETAGRRVAVLPSLVREEPERASMLTSLGRYYTGGHPVDWRRVYPGREPFLQLPTYPWQRQRCWFEPSGQRLVPGGAGQQASGGHPLLNRHLHSARNPDEHFWETDLGSHLPYLADRGIQGGSVLPAVVYLELALAAASEALGPGSYRLVDQTIHEILILPEGETTTLQCILAREPSGEARFEIFRQEGDDGSGTSTLLASGAVEADDREAPEKEGLAAIQERCAEEMSGGKFYQAMRERGLQLAVGSQGLEKVWRSDGEALAWVRLLGSEAGRREAFHLDPNLLYACLEALAAALPPQGLEGSGRLGIYLPARLESFRLYRRSDTHLWVHARLRDRDDAGFSGDVRFVDESGGVVAAVEGIRFEHLAPAALARLTHELLADWLYGVRWDPSPREGARDDQEGRSWLVLADAPGLGEELVDGLRERGEPAVLVVPGTECGPQGPSRWTVNPDRQEDFERLLREAPDPEPAGGRRIVHLWGLASTPDEEDLPQQVAATLTQGCGSVLHLVRALAATGQEDSSRLWLVTARAQPVGERAEVGPSALAQAPIWGLGRVLTLEHPGLLAGLVDLDDPGSDAADLLAEVLSYDGEDQVAFRGGERYVARLAREVRRTAESEPPGVRSDATYMVVTQVPSLGVEVARWLAAEGARHLLLVGCENGAPAQEIPGAEVLRLPAEGEPIREALAEAREAGRPLRGVVRSGGPWRPRLLADLAVEDLRGVFSAEAAGALRLHRLLQGEELDFFLLFSSAISVWGSMGFGHYAAAHHFVDTLAHYRHSRGLPAMAINWVAWSEVGQISEEDLKLSARMGVDALPPGEALEVLRRLMVLGAPQATVAKVDWGLLKPLYEAKQRRPFLEEMETSEKAEGATTGVRTTFLVKLSAAPAGERRDLLVEHLRAEVSQVLGFGEEEVVDAREGFFQMGMDSVMAVELKTRLESFLDCSLPPTLTFEHPTIEDVAGYLLREVLELRPGAEGGEAPEEAPAGAAEPGLPEEDLSESQLVALLAEELTTIDREKTR